MHFDQRAQAQSLRRTPVNGSVAAEPEPTKSPKRKVQRHSPDQLLQRKVVLPGDITVSAEKHNGRLVVRVESPQNEH
jgi:hypothetical protein